MDWGKELGSNHWHVFLLHHLSPTQIMSWSHVSRFVGLLLLATGVQRYRLLFTMPVLSLVLLGSGLVLRCLLTPSRSGPHLGGTRSLTVGTYAGLTHPFCMFTASDLAQFLLVRNNSFTNLFPICNKG